ncbi:MAG: hypothetical protein J4432_03910 [DPANN group archaeon]|nr:hypothetical protein [DPANN group archaeon]
MADDTSIDAGKASSIAKQYLIDTYGNLGQFTFKIHSIKRNSAEHIWIVECESYATPKDEKPTAYTIKVNIKTGEIVSISSI